MPTLTLPVNYNLTESTMRTLAQRREDIHRAIRLQQIEARFQHERILLREIDSREVIATVMDSLAALQCTLEADDEAAVSLRLTQLHNVAMQYAIVDCLLIEVTFHYNIQPVREGKLPLGCTWIDLFLVLLQWEDELVREQASALICLSLYQIRLAMEKRQPNTEYTHQIKRVLDRLPLGLLSDRNIKIAINSLDSVNQLLQTENSHEVIPYLLGIHPDFLAVVVGLFEAARDMNLNQYSEKVVETALMVLYVTSQIQYFQQLLEIQTLKELVKHALVSKIYNGGQDCMFFKKIRALSLCRVALSGEQLQTLLQKTLMAQMEDRNTDYLQMVASVLLAGGMQISPQATQVFANALFSAVERTDEAEVDYRRWLAVILYKNLPVFRDMARSGISVAVCGWEEEGFSERFGFLLSLAHESSEALFNLLIWICYAIYEAVPQLTPLLDQKLSSLSKYAEWRTMIEDCRFPCRHSVVE